MVCYENYDSDWPLRSRDLNPLDFFLWGYLKEIVLRQQISYRELHVSYVTANPDRSASQFFS